MNIILASKSPRRKEILASLGLAFDIVVADADESSDIQDPCLLVETLAARKGEAVIARIGDPADTLVIACDTLVYAEGEFLGKPRDKTDAARMIRKLSGKSHQVVSGLFLSYNGKKVSCSQSTSVHFDPMTDAEIEAYVNSTEPYDKAGAYAIQGRASAFINSIEGDYFNVVGLPVNLLCRTVKAAFGFSLTENM